MNTFFKDLLRKAAPCIGLIALLCGLAFAQGPQAKLTNPTRTDVVSGHPNIVAPTAEGVLSPNQIVVNRRSPIAYKPLPCVDPKTGKPVSPDTLLMLPNGKKVTEGQYCAEINKFEQQLNAIGYTLRPGPGDRPGVTTRIELQKIATPTATLQRQGQTLSSSYLPALRFQPLNMALEVQKQKAIITFAPGLLNTVGNSNRPLTLQEVKNWNYTLGDPSSISVSANGKLELDGTSTSTSLDAEATIAGSLFSHSFNMMQATGKLSSPTKGPLNLNVNVSVIGVNVYNVNQNTTGVFTKSDAPSSSLDESTNVHFTILGIPFTAKVGVQGSIGLTYSVTIAPVKATGVFLPAVNTKAYGQLAVDVVVASAGIRSALTILNFNGNLNGNVAIVPNAKNQPTYSYNAQFCQNLSALDGSLVAFLTIGVDPISKEFDTTLFSFNGFQSNGCLFSESKTSPVFSQPVALP